MRAVPASSYVPNSGRLLIAWLTAALFLASLAPHARAMDLKSTGVPQVWLSPAFSFVGHTGSVDNQQLFTEPGAWPEARRRVSVFKIAVHTLNQMPDDDLRRMFGFLKENHIAFAVEYGMLTATDACGKGVEGYKPEHMPTHISLRVQKLGGSIRYLAMDEPLFFGHYFDGNHACHWTIDAIAQSAAANIRQFRAIFPDVEVGDIEPVNAIRTGNWLDEVREWIEAYRKSTGVPLAFFHEDMIWRVPVAERTKLLTQLLDSQRIKFGVIFNSRGDVSSDQEWLDSVKRNIAEYRANSPKAPDQIIIQSWKSYPTHVLPESNQYTLTHLVNYYFVGQ